MTSPEASPATSPFADLHAFTSLPRVTGLAVRADGERVVVTVSAPDADHASYTSALWEVGDGVEPRRLTWSEKGESSPEFAPDGTLLFTSGRPDPQDPDATPPALWSLPAYGEAHVVARTPGGLRSPVARGDVVVAAGSRLAGSTDAEDDEERRADRKRTRTTAIEHTGMPVRYWDDEVGLASPRLYAVRGDEVTDLAPDAGFALREASYDLSHDGSFVLTTWSVRERRARSRSTVVRLDLATGDRTTVLDVPGVDYADPHLSPSGEHVVVGRLVRGTFDTPHDERLEVHALTGGDPVVLQVGDVDVSSVAWSTDGGTVYAAGDLHGRGAVLALDPRTGEVRRTLADDASYSHLTVAGRWVFALRAAMDRPATPVRLDPELERQEAHFLDAPGDPGPLPGTVTRVGTTVDGVEVPGWLCLPPEPAGAPLMTWVHGGPFSSWNAWSWRWSPWVAVARGYAVLLPDPALSTGYGAEAIARAWPHRAGIVWREVEALLDHVLSEYPVDRGRTALLGASFGGYMTNWIAGHTDRFRAIVTHAGLWALDQQHTTTDMAAYKTGLFGRVEEHPDWYAENSPHHFVRDIRTPMLVVHGNRDYRVPVSEALRLWFDLVEGFDGEPEDLPHRFLQFTGQNHWILSPTDAEVWYDAVLGFCDRHLA